MSCTRGNIGRLVFLQEPGLVADGHFGSSRNHDPMFRAMVMLLQRELRARLHDDPLRLKALAPVHGLVGAPGPMDAGWLVRACVLAVSQLLDDLLSILRAIERCEEHRVL